MNLDKPKTSQEVIEDGINLIARGLFQINETEGPKKAEEAAYVAIVTIRRMWMDFLKWKREGEKDG